jgi:hypothetical protein
MAKKSISERIAQLEAQKKTLQARLGKQERAKDTRRKVLLGALVLHRMKSGGDGEFSKRLGDWLRRELPGFLTRDFDKALFADLLGVSDAGRLVGLADVSATPASVDEAKTVAGASVNFSETKISALAEKPAQQRGKTAAEVLGHRFDENV